MDGALSVETDTGTVTQVGFLPDSYLHYINVFDIELLSQRLDGLAYLNAGLEIASWYNQICEQSQAETLSSPLKPIVHKS